jgi:phage I-like protein
MKGINLVASAALELPTDGPRRAPTAFPIWRPGPNRGDFGVTNVTPRAARRVLAAYQARGNFLAIDIEHNTNRKANPKYDPSNPPRGGGYLAIALRETLEGLWVWADPVRWSDYARAQIEGGERCYISPDWDNDPTTGEPIEIKRVSLVMEPGTYGIPLLASRAACAPARPITLLPRIDRIRLS